MTEQELSGYKFIMARIEEIKERIAELEHDIAELEQENGLGSVNLDGMPHGSTPGDPVARMAIARAALHEDMKKLKADLEKRCVELLGKEREIREYIDSIDDEEVKLIIEWRFIDLLDWYEIAGRLEEVTGKCVDRSTPGKKMRNYLQKH
jgi:hypothetical protein